jgi:hypothetical protein
MHTEHGTCHHDEEAGMIRITVSGEQIHLIARVIAYNMISMYCVQAIDLLTPGEI